MLLSAAGELSSVIGIETVPVSLELDGPDVELDVLEGLNERCRWLCTFTQASTYIQLSFNMDSGLIDVLPLTRL